MLTLISPLYSMNPRSLNLFMKKLTRERVVPTIRDEPFGDAALLNVHDGIARLPLREDDFPFGICRHAPRGACGREEGFGVEGR